jgi:hypothetical protein
MCAAPHAQECALGEDHDWLGLVVVEAVDGRGAVDIGNGERHRCGGAVGKITEPSC